MGRALTAVGALLALCFIGFGAVVYVAREEEQIAVDNLLSEDLTRTFALAEDESDGVVELAALTDFDWEEMLLVERGAPDATITQALGFPWRGDVPIEQGDVFIFLAEGQVARYADYRGEGRFEGVERPIARLSRDEAVFSARDLVFRLAGPGAQDGG
jgi:hypothetical protein